MPVFNGSGLDTEELPSIYGSGEALGKAIIGIDSKTEALEAQSGSHLLSRFNVGSEYRR